MVGMGAQGIAFMVTVMTIKASYAWTAYGSAWSTAWIANWATAWIAHLDLICSSFTSLNWIPKKMIDKLDLIWWSRKISWNSKREKLMKNFKEKKSMNSQFIISFHFLFEFKFFFTCNLASTQLEVPNCNELINDSIWLIDFSLLNFHGNRETEDFKRTWFDFESFSAECFFDVFENKRLNLKKPFEILIWDKLDFFYLF